MYPDTLSITATTLHSRSILTCYIALRWPDRDKLECTTTSPKESGNTETVWAPSRISKLVVNALRILILIQDALLPRMRARTKSRTPSDEKRTGTTPSRRDSQRSRTATASTSCGVLVSLASWREHEVLLVSIGSPWPDTPYMYTKTGSKLDKISSTMILTDFKTTRRFVTRNVLIILGQFTFSSF